MHEMHFVCSFFSAARRTNQEAPPRLSGFWLVATVAVGVCGTRFARTVLALFPPSSLRLHRPIKAESGDLACILTPSPYGHSPYILRRKTQGRRVRVTFRSLRCNTPHTGHGRGRRLNTNDFLSQSKKVLVTLIRFICSFFSAARRTNQEAPPRLSGFWLVATVAVGVCGTRFARTVLAHFSSVSLATSPPDKGGIGGLLVF